MDYGELNGPQLGLLSDVIVALFRAEDELNVFLVRNGFQGVSSYPRNLSLPNLSFYVVENNYNTGEVGRLMKALQSTFPNAPTLRNLDEKLQVLESSTATPPPPIAVPRGFSSPLQWILSTTEWSDPLILAEELVAHTRRLCLIRSEVGGRTNLGTGFLVAENKVLTAYHVLERLHRQGGDPDQTRLIFDFAATTAGVVETQSVGLSRDWLLAHAPYSAVDLTATDADPSADELDFALLSLAEPIGVARGFIQLSDSVDKHSVGDLITILQHPEGGLARQSFGWITPGNATHRLRYSANTLSGSSGGLVLTNNLRPLALHHAGDPKGRLQAEYNQGIPLTEIYTMIRALL